MPCLVAGSPFEPLRQLLVVRSYSAHLLFGMFVVEGLALASINSANGKVDYQEGRAELGEATA
jgi:hypothetical protein